MKRPDTTKLVRLALPAKYSSQPGVLLILSTAWPTNSSVSTGKGTPSSEQAPLESLESLEPEPCATALLRSSRGRFGHASGGGRLDLGTRAKGSGALWSSALAPLSRPLSLPLVTASHFFLASSSPSSTTCLIKVMDSLELLRSLSIPAIDRVGRQKGRPTGAFNSGT